jgi:hypothetical protein
MQRAFAASVRYGLAAPGAHHHARATSSSKMGASASGAGAWARLSAPVSASPHQAATPDVSGGGRGSPRRAVRVCRAISTDAPAASSASAESSASYPTNPEAPTFQDAILRLQQYWSSKGCAIWLPHNTEVGAGTMNPATFLRSLGPEPWSVCYPEPSIRPDDSRYGRVGTFRARSYLAITKHQLTTAAASTVHMTNLTPPGSEYLYNPSRAYGHNHQLVTAGMVHVTSRVTPGSDVATLRCGDNPNRVQRHTQFQVILKPDPGNAQELYLGSLEALGGAVQVESSCDP